MSQNTASDGDRTAANRGPRSVWSLVVHESGEGWPSSAVSRCGGEGENFVARMGAVAVREGLGSRQVRLLGELTLGSDLLEFVDMQADDRTVADCGRRFAARLGALFESVEAVEIQQRGSQPERRGSGAAGSSQARDETEAARFEPRPRLLPRAKPIGRSWPIGADPSERFGRRRGPYDEAPIRAGADLYPEDEEGARVCQTCLRRPAARELAGVECWDCFEEH